MGTRNMHPSPSPILYPWAQYGPWAVRRILDLAGPRTLIRCERTKAESELGGDFGNPSDLVVILDAYRRAYG